MHVTVSSSLSNPRPAACFVDIRMQARVYYQLHDRASKSALELELFSLFIACVELEQQAGGP
jgi:hypothetical protein